MTPTYLNKTLELGKKNWRVTYHDLEERGNYYLIHPYLTL